MASTVWTASESADEPSEETQPSITTDEVSLLVRSVLCVENVSDDVRTLFTILSSDRGNVDITLLSFGISALCRKDRKCTVTMICRMMFAESSGWRESLYSSYK